MATNPFQNLAFPQSSMAARPTMQPAAAPAAPAQPTQAQRFRSAYFNMLANPDMPLEQQFSTDSAKLDEQAALRARYARMLAAGQAAVAERAAAQGRLQGTDPETGAPIIGAAAPSPIVQESPGGVRVAYRNGVPVGFSTPQPTMPFVGEAQQIIPTATRLAADQSASRLNATAQFYKGMRAAEETLKDIQNLESRLNRLSGTGEASAPAPAPVAPTRFSLPTVPVRPTPLASAPFRDTSGRVDTAAVAEAQGRVPSAAHQPAAAFADMTPEEQLAEAEAQSQEVYEETAKMLEEAPRKAAEQKVAAKEQQIKDLQRQLAEAQAKRSSADIGRLSRMLRAMLQSRTTVEQELRKIEEASREPMFIGP